MSKKKAPPIKLLNLVALKKELQDIQTDQRRCREALEDVRKGLLNLQVHLTRLSQQLKGL